MKSFEDILTERGRALQSIIESTDKIIPLLKNLSAMDIKISDTITKIFDLTGALLGVLPKIVVEETAGRSFKKDLIEAFEKLKNAWEEYEKNPDLFRQFFDSWKQFVEIWRKTFKSISEFEKKENIFTISLN